MITATELLDFLTKAQRVSGVGATFRQTDEGYKITLYCDWNDDGNNYEQSIFIDKEGESTWDNGEDYDFYTMNDILDEMIELQKQKEIKAQKRKELIDACLLIVNTYNQTDMLDGYEVPTGYSGPCGSTTAYDFMKFARNILNQLAEDN